MNSIKSISRFSKTLHSIINEASKYLHYVQTRSIKREGKQEVCDEVITMSTLHSNAKDGRIRVTLIPGDGIGPELVRSVKQVFVAGAVPIEWDTLYFSEISYEQSASLKTVVNSIRKNKVCLQGILATPFSITDDPLTLNIRKRKALQLFANVIHIKNLPGIKSKFKDIDLYIVREQTEGEYSALEHTAVKGQVESLKIITRKKSDRIAKFCFDFALRMKRKKITAVHKANIMKLSDGLFLKSCTEMAKFYPSIKFETVIVDNCSMQLVSNPQQYDVLLTPNLYGDILCSMAAGLVGGPGVVPGSCYSMHEALFEQGARHEFARAFNKNICNPTGMLLASANMLQHINLQPYSKLIRKSVLQVLKEGKIKTRDMGGFSTTQEFTEEVMHKLKCFRK